MLSVLKPIQLSQILDAVKAREPVLKGKTDPRLWGLLEKLSLPALQEFAAIIWFAKDDFSTFAAKLSHAREVIDTPSIGYIIARPLETLLPSGLKKLGLTLGN